MESIPGPLPALRRQLTLSSTSFQGLLLVALACLVYAPYLANSLVFDDLTLFNGLTIYDFAAELWRNQARWLSYATLAHSYLLSDGSIVALRIENVLLHAANAILVFLLLRGLLDTADDRGIKAVADPVDARRIALLAAALFAVNPVAVYGVGYLVQRSGLMATLFMLLMLIAYLRWLTGGRVAAWIWSAFWYLLSVLSKEHSVAAPAVALLLTLVLRRPTLGLARRLAAPFAAYAAIAVMITLIVKGVLGTPYEKYAVDMLAQAQGVGAGQAAHDAYLLSLSTQAWLFFKYIFLWVVPNPAWMSMDLREPLARSLFSWPYWAAAIAFLCYPVVAAGMAIRGGRVGVAGWALAFPWLMFVTELATARVQEPFVLYRAYLWFPVIGVVLPLAMSTISRRAATLAVAVIVCVCVPLSWNRLASLASPLAAWSDAAKLLHGDEPGAGRIYYNRALALSAAGRLDDAMKDMDRAVALHPRISDVRMGRATLLFKRGRFPEALDEINAALALDPNRGDYLLGRAVTLQRLGRKEEAAPDFRKACDLKVLVACMALQQSGKKGNGG